VAAVAFDYDKEAPRVVKALRKAFPRDTIDTKRGYLGRVQVTVVSSVLNGKTEAEKQSYVWDVLRSNLGEESQVVSIVTPYGTDEL